VTLKSGVAVDEVDAERRAVDEGDNVTEATIETECILVGETELEIDAEGECETVPDWVEAAEVVLEARGDTDEVVVADADRETSGDLDTDELTEADADSLQGAELDTLLRGEVDGAGERDDVTDTWRTVDEIDGDGVLERDADGLRDCRPDTELEGVPVESKEAVRSAESDRDSENTAERVLSPEGVERLDRDLGSERDTRADPLTEIEADTDRDNDGEADTEGEVRRVFSAVALRETTVDTSADREAEGEPEGVAEGVPEADADEKDPDDVAEGEVDTEGETLEDRETLGLTEGRIEREGDAVSVWTDVEGDADGELWSDRVTALTVRLIEGDAETDRETLDDAVADGDARIVALTLTDREMSGETETENETLGECVPDRLGSVERVSAALLESERSGVCDRVRRGELVVEREMSGEADVEGHADDVFDILADVETVPQAEDDLEPEGERVSKTGVPVARVESDAAAETEAAALSVSMKVAETAMDDVIEGDNEIFGEEEIDKDSFGERD
jgi:hypothetical protein